MFTTTMNLGDEKWKGDRVANLSRKSFTPFRVQDNPLVHTGCNMQCQNSLAAGTKGIGESMQICQNWTTLGGMGGF